MGLRIVLLQPINAHILYNEKSVVIYIGALVVIQTKLLCVLRNAMKFHYCVQKVLLGLYPEPA